MKRVMGIFIMLLSVLLFAGCDSITGEIENYGDARSSNALLKDLKVSEGEWEYAFNMYDNEYKISVGNEVESIQVKPTVDHVFSTVTVNDEEVSSGSNSGAINLSVGQNTITIAVTSWDETLNTYTLTVTRELSTITSITTIAITDPVDAQITDAGNNNYTAVVGNSIETIRLNIETSHAGAAIEIRLAHNGTVDIGSDIIINSGLNLFLIKVTAEDGIAKEYYTAEITKLSGDATDCKVNSLSIQKTTLDPTFDADDHNGEASYDFNAEISSGKLTGGEVTTNLILITNSGIATTAITDPSGTANYSEGGQITHPLNQADFPPREAPYVITCVVTSGDSSNSVTYNINLTVRAGNNDATLSNGDGITLNWGSEHNSRTVVYPGTFASHNPRTYGFLSNYNDYIAVMYATDTVRVTAKANDPNAASIKINGVTGSPDAQGCFSSDVALSVGFVTDVVVTVKAEDNTTTEIYTIRIKLLNVHEYYWGIYSPVNSKSYARWDYWKNEEHGLTIDDELYDYTTADNVILGNGYLYWKTTTKPDSYMKWINYNDGNAGGGTWDVRTDYNYNHPTDPNLDGFVIGEGETYGYFEGISMDARDGYVYGGFTLDTPWGDPIAEVMSHYWINDQIKVVCDESWAEVYYMGELHKMMYADDSGPNPFTDPSFDWEVPWVPAGYPITGYPKAKPDGWSWHLQYDNPPNEDPPPGNWK